MTDYCDWKLRLSTVTANFQLRLNTATELKNKPPVVASLKQGACWLWLSSADGIHVVTEVAVVNFFVRIGAIQVFFNIGITIAVRIHGAV